MMSARAVGGLREHMDELHGFIGTVQWLRWQIVFAHHEKSPQGLGRSFTFVGVLATKIPSLEFLWLVVCCVTRSICVMFCWGECAFSLSGCLQLCADGQTCERRLSAKRQEGLLKCCRYCCPVCWVRVVGARVSTTLTWNVFPCEIYSMSIVAWGEG